jgi:hypothetical protein
MSNTDPTITAQIETFTQQLVATVEAAVAQRIQAALAGAFGVPQKRGPGRPPKQAVAHVAPVAVEKSAERKKPPKQLCPVPGCKNVAAPIFGMVCKDHKNVAKSKIKKYREERREGSIEEELTALQTEMQQFLQTPPDRASTLMRRLEHFDDLRRKANLYQTVLQAQVEGLAENLTEMERQVHGLLDSKRAKAA